MKIYTGSGKVNSLMLHTDSDDATLKASDLQSGVTAYAKGRKVTGSGKSFAFALYGDISSNATIPIPTSEINTVIVGAVGYSVKMTQAMKDLRNTALSTAQEVAVVTVDGTEYPITVTAASDTFKIACSQTLSLQIMFGKDEYI